MQDTYRVIITDRALADLQRVAGYIRNQSPDHAAGMAKKIVDAIDSLDAMPGRFKRVGKSRKRGTPIHAMVVRPFIVYYRVDLIAKGVFILNIIHGARRQPRRFE